MKNLLFAFVLAIASLAGASAANAAQPNIVVILTEDQGYADNSLNPQHAKEVSTPHMDALANDGVSFSQGYTSGHVCSPTRAGIMIGGYQQRVGVYTSGDGGAGAISRNKERQIILYLPVLCPAGASQNGRVDQATFASAGLVPVGARNWWLPANANDR